jgi:DNA ligase 1
VDRLALVCEDVARNASRLRKIDIVADYLRSLDDSDFFLAVQFLSAGPVAEANQNYTLFDVEKKPKLSVGGSVLRDALRTATAWDKDTLSVCYAQVGDTGETVGLLMRGLSAERPLSLTEANAFYQELFATAVIARKREILTAAFLSYKPLTLKYLVKMITRGLRIGLMEKMVEEAVAQACGVQPDLVRDANNRLGDLARVAIAARHGELSGIAARLFHPMEFMLAKPLDRVEDIAKPEDWIIEDKYDGIRSQVHFDSGRVQIFSRGMEDVTAAFPEIAEAFSYLKGNGLIDGELLGWRNGRALSFNLLQQRLARKRVRATLMLEVPVVFMAYDILLRNDTLLLGHSLEERRARIPEMPVAMLSPQHQASSHADIEELFRRARDRGNEGLLLKRKGSIYEPGRRSGSWLKLKRPYGTLDVVVTAAEQGQGRRAIYLSDYTFAVRSSNGFLNIGKAYSGLTDSEVKELTRVLRSASMEKFGRVVLVRPEIVLEVAFDGVQKSPRHKSGYALRFPRILRWRKDKKPEECDDLARVEALYQTSLS